MDTKKLGIYAWECEDEECGWEGDYPDNTPSYIFLKVDEEECEPEWIETCPKCGKQAIYSNMYALRLLFKK